MKRRLRLIARVGMMAGVLLLSACGVLGKLALARKPLDLTILHTGQVYGEILPCG